MCLYASPLLTHVHPHSAIQILRGSYIHIGVGFDVAYLSELGKFDGLESEVSDEYGSHASFIYVVSFTNNNSCRRSQGQMGAKAFKEISVWLQKKYLSLVSYMLERELS